MKRASHASRLLPGSCRILTLLLPLLGAPAPAAVIDTFSAVKDGDPDYVLTSGVGTNVTDFAIAGPVSDPIGSRRRLTVIQNSVGQSADITIDGTSGAAVLDSTGGATSEWKIHYGIGFSDLHFDATAGGATAFRLMFDNVSGSHEYVIGAYGYSGSGTSNSGTFQPLSPVLDVPFTSFSNYGGIGFNDLNQVEIRIRNVGLTHGGTSSITLFQTVVPEPSRGLLLLAGAIAVNLRRRRSGSPGGFGRQEARACPASAELAA